MRLRTSASQAWGSMSMSTRGAEQGVGPYRDHRVCQWPRARASSITRYTLAALSALQSSGLIATAGRVIARPIVSSHSSKTPCPETAFRTSRSRSAQCVWAARFSMIQSVPPIMRPRSWSENMTDPRGRGSHSAPRRRSRIVNNELRRAWAPLRTAMPCSIRNARIWLIVAIRLATSLDRTRCNACRSS